MSYSQDFYARIKRKHNLVDPCFMTGKGCVYTEPITRTLNESLTTHKYTAFAVMPLRQNLGVFYHNCLVPFFEGTYNRADNENKETVEIGRGDQIRRPGVVICEGICKRIQESNFVIADISLPNANVFYELGLAYGIGQKIVVVHHQSSGFGKKTSEDLSHAGCRSYSYKGLLPIDVAQFDVSQYIWERSPDEIEDPNVPPGILLFERPKYISTDEPVETASKETNDETATWFDFETHVLSAVGLSIDKIYRELDAAEPSKVIKNYLKIIEKLKGVTQVQETAHFMDTRRQVDSSYCLIVRTGRDCDPMSYFWLGYGHARGKNVIPITIIKNPKDQIDDLAFDIRSQRHMTFVQKAPELLEREIEQTFRQMISTDFSEWSRKRFWDEMLGRRGEVFVFTGALHNKEFDREMIGDWDLRAVSELASYFGRNQYRAVIDTPVYGPEYVNPQQPNNEEFIRQLREMIANKNCILIASPDVNPLTEIVLGKTYGIPDDKLFSEAIETQTYPDAIVVVKEKKEEQASYNKHSALYSEVVVKGEPGRGFKSNQIPKGKITTPFTSQGDQLKKDFHVMRIWRSFPILLGRMIITNAISSS
jgi:hypothetical protein